MLSLIEFPQQSALRSDCIWRSRVAAEYQKYHVVTQNVSQSLPCLPLVTVMHTHTRIDVLLAVDDLGVESDRILSTGTLARLKLTATCLPYVGDDKYLTQREGCWQGGPLS